MTREIAAHVFATLTVWWFIVGCLVNGYYLTPASILAATAAWLYFG